MKQYKHIETEEVVEAEFIPLRGKVPSYCEENPLNAGTYLYKGIKGMRLDRGTYCVIRDGDESQCLSFQQWHFERDYMEIEAPGEKPKAKPRKRKVTAIAGRDSD